MLISELPGIEEGHACWWKLVAAMGVIRTLEARAEAAEAREAELRSVVGPEALRHRMALQGRVAELEAALHTHIARCGCDDLRAALKGNGAE